MKYLIEIQELYDSLEQPNESSEDVIKMII